MKTFLVIISVIAIFFGAMIFLQLCHTSGTISDSANGVIDKTLNSDNVIYNYEYFKQAYQDIKTLDKQIIDAQQASQTFDQQFKNRKDMDRDDKQESDRLHAIVLGLQQQRQNEASTYNARAQMTNRDIFKDHDLPNSL